MQIMRGSRYIRQALVLVAILGPAALGSELSTYRGFHLGASLNAAVKQSGMAPSEVALLHTRPARIEELQWRPGRFFGPSATADAVDQVRLLFINGRLFRIVVDYDSERIEGLTTQDLIERISAQYGTASSPAATMILTSGYADEKAQILAQWQDADYSLNLVQLPYSSTFKIVILDKALDAEAEAALTESVRLDAQQAPLSLIVAELNAKSTLDKSRASNKANFKP